MTTGPLPNLLVVGVPKAGTGSLFAYLSQHPDICGADEKEVGYFNFYNPRRHTGTPPPLAEYRRHFAHCRSERYAFEATPTYSYGGRPVIEAIASSLPAPKIVLSLRDPVARLWSAYTFQRELGNLGRFRSFEEYVVACEQRARDGSDLVPHDHMHGLYIGYYADYVPLWLEAFGADIKVVFADDLASAPAAVVSGLFEWLGVAPLDGSELDVTRRNPTHHPRSIRLAKAAYSLKRSVERAGLLPAPVRASLKRAYARANSGQAPGTMSAATRDHLTTLYRESNAATARALQEHGYEALPAWLAASTGSRQEPAH